jgi:hypothetical protein
MNPDFERRLLELVDQALEPRRRPRRIPSQGFARGLGTGGRGGGPDRVLRQAEADDRFPADSAAVFADPIIRAVRGREKKMPRSR